MLWVWCDGSFQGSREKDDIIGSRRVKSLSLGRLPWISPAYFKKTQASKLGDAHCIPFFIVKIIRSSLVKLYFNSFTSYVLFLERLCAFIFSIALLFSIKLDWTLAFLIGRETRSAFSWEYSYSSLIFVEYSYLALFSF